ncbi:glycerophosphodiester phosphodiesterase [Paraflavitalea speifideaquila]|uniref:glycerophosphodiester phosphodiesterase n=1 Tax=Paraflavitalea speifideaquila TaxID=3076558 RepID=UPI0028E81992|nr:glycerophosphodiester phosphodiesterase family protein [Paraflavitalea speifideiaquila]
MPTHILNSHFKIIAYRGGTQLFPENSIAAITASLQANPHIIIEIDLQITKDQVVVAFHDFHLDDLTNGKGPVRDLTWDELKKLFLKNPDGTVSTVSRISTLDEIFCQFPNQLFVLDLHENNRQLFDRVIEVVEKNNRQHQTALVSIAKGAIESLRQLRPDWTFMASPRETRQFIVASKLSLQRFVKTPSNIMFLPDKLGSLQILSAKAIKELHRRKVKVWTCTNFKPYENVNTPADLDRLKALGVDGIYTDNPQALAPSLPTTNAAI